MLNDGEIVERGRHDQLLDESGLYAEMWNQQLKNLEGEKLRDEKEEKSLSENNSQPQQQLPPANHH